MEDNSNSLRYWIFTLTITNYCMNKSGFHCALSICPFSSFPCSILLLLLLHIPRLLTLFVVFFLVPLQVSNVLSFAYLSLSSLSSTQLHYQVQLWITPRQIIFVSLDSFRCTKIYITIYLIIWFMQFHAARKHASHVFILGSLGRVVQSPIKASSTPIRFQTKTELFSSTLQRRKRSRSKTLSRVERFENDAFWKRCFLVWTEKTMLSENGDVMKIHDRAPDHSTVSI